MYKKQLNEYDFNVKSIYVKNFVLLKNFIEFNNYK